MKHLLWSKPWHLTTVLRTLLGLNRNISTHCSAPQRLNLDGNGRIYPKINHPFGYQYIQLICNRWLEILILAWNAGIGSKPHNHHLSINFTRVLSGQLLERKYCFSAGQLIIVSEKVIHQGQWTWTSPHEIHELVSLDNAARTLHVYFPGRLSLKGKQAS